GWGSGAWDKPRRTSQSSGSTAAAARARSRPSFFRSPARLQCASNASARASFGSSASTVRRRASAPFRLPALISAIAALSAAARSNLSMARPRRLFRMLVEERRNVVVEPALVGVFGVVARLAQPFQRRRLFLLERLVEVFLANRNYALALKALLDRVIARGLYDPDQVSARET